MRWLITGGCGFIGCNLIQRLVGDGGHAVRVFDNLSVGSVEDLQGVTPCRLEPGADDGFPEVDDPVAVRVGDVRDASALATAARGADVVVHLAANAGVMPSISNPLEDCAINVLGTLHALEAARASGVPRFVFASSSAPLGEQDPPIDESKLPRPLSPYGASKLAGESYCSVYSACYGITTVVLRFGNVYGPNSSRKQSVVARFIRRALTAQPLVIYGTGKQTRDFVYVKDLVDAILLAARCERGGEVFQIATNTETTVHELAEALSPLLREHAGVEVEVRHESPRAGEVERSYSDISKARSILGWQPRHTLKQGLRKTVEWFTISREQDVVSRETTGRR